MRRKNRIQNSGRERLKGNLLESVKINGTVGSIYVTNKILKDLQHSPLYQVFSEGDDIFVKLKPIVRK
jgi:hypothetical protein